MSAKSLLVGAFTLAAFDTVLSLPATQQGALASVLATPGKWARDFMSPAVPLIPDLTASSSSTQPSSSTSGPTFQPISGAKLPPPPATPIVRTT